MSRSPLRSSSRVPRGHGRSFLVILLATLLAVAGVSVATSAPASAASSSSGAFVSAINAERARAGVSPLAIDAHMTSVAAGWSRHMAGSNVLAHNPGLAGSVRSWRYLGENVGVGYSVSSLVAAFWASAEHRANILDRHYDRIGVSVVDVGGKLWVTEDFLGTGHAAAAPKPRPVPHHSSPALVRHATHPDGGATSAPRQRATAAPPRPGYAECRAHAMARFGRHHLRHGEVVWPAALSACARI